ncbi:transmembrane 4 L6 family member 5-like, partial [Scleropages formosus]
MCTGKCARFIGVVLYPLALISIICNIMLFFPDWETKYAKEEREGAGPRITEQAKYMSGVIGGGVMMFLSIAFAAVGVVGALYSFSVSVVGLVNGPTCMYERLPLPLWGTPFTNLSESYLKNPEIWDLCLEPKNVVEFNVGLFSTLLVAASLELILCAFQMVNGLFGCICGTCNNGK